MRSQILDYLNDQITEGNVLKGTVKDKGGIDTIVGMIQAFEEVKEWVEEFDEDEE